MYINPTSGVWLQAWIPSIEVLAWENSENAICLHFLYKIEYSPKKHWKKVQITFFYSCKDLFAYISYSYVVS